MVYAFRSFVSLLLSAILTVCGFFTRPTEPMAEFYVSPYGNDENTGTQNSPFATIERARDAVRKINGNMTGDIVVHIGEGIYRLKNTVVFDERDGAANGYAVRYVADGKAVISGGDVLGGFTLFDREENIYSAQVPAGASFRAPVPRSTDPSGFSARQGSFPTAHGSRNGTIAGARKRFCRPITARSI